eukprot:2254713-Pleurochrysis_carterae.AAC.2
MREGAAGGSTPEAAAQAGDVQPAPPPPPPEPPPRADWGGGAGRHTHECSDDAPHQGAGGQTGTGDSASGAVRSCGAGARAARPGDGSVGTALADAGRDGARDEHGDAPGPLRPGMGGRTGAESAPEHMGRVGRDGDARATEPGDGPVDTSSTNGEGGGARPTCGGTTHPPCPGMGRRAHNTSLSGSII